MNRFLTEAQALVEDLIAFSHDLHQHPEVGMDLLCSLQAGDTYNIIPHTARIMGTMRSYDKQVHQRALDCIAELVQTTADSFHAKASLQFESSPK